MSAIYWTSPSYDYNPPIYTSIRNHTVSASEVGKLIFKCSRNPHKLTAWEVRFMQSIERRFNKKCITKASMAVSYKQVIVLQSIWKKVFK